MNHPLWLTAIAFPLLFSACGTAPSSTEAEAPGSAPNSQLEFALKSGTYKCERKVRIQVEREIQQGTNTHVNIVWNGNSYRLQRDASLSGLPRFADASGDLVWIDLPWKSLLLDGKTNKPLVNECHPG